MSARRLLLATLLIAGLGSSASAQAPVTTPTDFWKGQAAAIVGIRNKRPVGASAEVEKLINVNNLRARYLRLLHEQRTRNFDLRAVEDARTDKQVGSPASQPGSTGVVSRGAVPGIFGFAVENGALAAAQDGTVVTLRGGLIGWLDLVQNKGFIEAYEDDSSFVRSLRRVSYSITLDTSRTSEEKADTRPSLDAITESLKETARQITGYSVRLALLDHRDPRRPDNRTAVDQLLANSLLLEQSDFLDDFFASDAYLGWQKTTATVLLSPDLVNADVEKVLLNRLEQLAQQMRKEIPEFDTRSTEFVDAMDTYNRARASVFDTMQKRPVLALEYVRARPAGLPERSTLRFILDGQVGGWDTTGNVAWTYQHEGTVLVPEATLIEGTRDFQIAGQIERPLGSRLNAIASGSGIGPPAFAVGFLSQRLHEGATVTFAGHDFKAEPGWVHIAQAKLTIPVKGSGVKVPLSVSWANRSELIQEKTVRGQVGLTFDLDVITAGFLKR